MFPETHYATALNKSFKAVDIYLTTLRYLKKMTPAF